MGYLWYQVRVKKRAENSEFKKRAECGILGDFLCMWRGSFLGFAVCCCASDMDTSSFACILSMKKRTGPPCRLVCVRERACDILLTTILETMHSVYNCDLASRVYLSYLDRRYTIPVLRDMFDIVVAD